MKKSFFSWLFCLILCLPLVAQAQSEGFVFMASTIGPVDSGVVAALGAQFEQETGIRVRHVGAGTGEALKIAEKDKEGNAVTLSCTDKQGAYALIDRATVLFLKTK